MKPERPVFIGEGESTNMLDVLPNKLTLRRINKKFYPSNGNRAKNTIFKEVSIKPYQQSEEVTELINRPRKYYTSMEELFDIFKCAIERVWDPTKFHLIGHSSGVDSRLISKAIKELGEKNGDDWLGEVYYVENGGEGDLFNQIKDIMGFDGIVYGADTDPRLYNLPFLEFQNHWSKYTGVVAYPLNQWWDGYAQLDLPNNIQGFTGYGANETQTQAVYKDWGYAKYFKWLHGLQLTQWKHYGGDWEHPFLDADFLHALQSSGAMYLKRINVEMSRRMVPELNHIPHIHTNEITARGYRTVSDQLLKALYELYKSSYFGRKYDVTPTPQITYSKWWFYFNAASWCQHLIEKGYTIQ